MINRFLNDNKLVKVWPKKQADKILVLVYLVSKFDTDKLYSENEVNEVLKSWHTFSDWPLLRRELIDRGYMRRDINGHEYQVVKLSDQK